MNDSPSTRSLAHLRHNKWLVLIASFKLLQAALFIGIGIGALHLVHVDIDDFLTRVFSILRFNPESHFVNFVLEKDSILDARMLRRISAVVFAYAGLGLIEGIVARIQKELPSQARVIATGGYADLLASETKVFDVISPDLTLFGLRLIYYMNRA